MKIVEFTADYVEQALQIAKQNYEEERGIVTALPSVDVLPNLTEFAKNNLGVAAVDGGKLLGFFCWFEPWDNHFGKCKGTWSPVHAHGAITQSRSEIYDRLYQSAAERLVSLGAFSHSVTLYHHDAKTNEIFFHNGFGSRCVDAIRDTAPITFPILSGVTFRQADAGDAETLAELSNKLDAHMRQSPIFMTRDRVFTAADVTAKINGGHYHYFIALEQNRAVSFIRIGQSGENFVSVDSAMMNINGAYTMPEARGTGVAVGLLSYLMDWLHERGYSLCGVDFESFNFTARKFWLKYFTAYTTSVVRRIDERICR
jgi:GNAT superfamily N-acetyltransferase